LAMFSLVATYLDLVHRVAACSSSDGWYR